MRENSKVPRFWNSIPLRIRIYLLLSAYELSELMVSQKPFIPIFGMIISIFLLSSFVFYKQLYSKGGSFLNYISPLIFRLILFGAICYLGYMVAYFVTMIHIYRTFKEPSVDLMSITSSLGDIFFVILLYAGVIIISFLLAYLVCCSIKYKEPMVLDEKALKHEKQGDYKKAIELGNKELSILEEMKGLFVKIDPFHKLSIQSCYSTLSKWYYLIGDYDNTVKNLRKVRELDNETVDSIYRGEADISGLINEVIEPQAFENNIFKKYLKIKGFIKKPTILQKMKFEHGLVFGLFLVFALYVFTLLHISV